jgi:hypothetical protein
MPNCFIIMPISTPKALVPLYRGDDDHFRHVLDHLFIPAIEKAGLHPVPPKVSGPDIIHATIVKYIEQSDLVLCDMSSLNPNVFFELGIRTAVDRAACIVIDDMTSEVPFDTGIVNYHSYKSSLHPWLLSEEIEQLAAHIAGAQASDGRNALWRFFGLTARAELSTKEAGIDAKIDLLSMRVDGLTRHLTAQGGQAAATREQDPKESLSRLTMGLNAAANRGLFTILRASIDDQKQLHLYVRGSVSDESRVELVDVVELSGYTLGNIVPVVTVMG